MIKALVSAALLSFSFQAFAQTDGLELTGFKILKTDSQSTTVQFREGAKTVLSVEKFSKVEDARAFCVKRGMKLAEDGLGVVLLVAMSGAANMNERLNAAISYEVKIDGAVKQSGLWAFDEKSGDIAVMIDGRGMDVERLTAEELRRMSAIKGASVPKGPSAICQ